MTLSFAGLAVSSFSLQAVCHGLSMHALLLQVPTLSASPTLIRIKLIIRVEGTVVVILSVDYMRYTAEAGRCNPPL